MAAVKTAIMYIQRGWESGRIGRVRLSKTGRTVFYRGRELVLTGGYKTSHMDVETRAEYWISKPRRDGEDTLYPGRVEIDDDARDEYWRTIRNQPERAADASYRSLGAHAKHATR